jgi:two-component system chemotaxis sensor kinase CheA
MKVFLEGAEEQLQLLDEEVIRLEKESSEEGLPTVFRAAHTLKGSPAIIGYRAMTEVAHAMESMLDKLRNHLIVETPKSSTRFSTAWRHFVCSMRSWLTPMA